MPTSFRCDGIFNEQQRARRINTLGREVLINVQDLFEHGTTTTVSIPATSTVLAPAPPTVRAPTLPALEMGTPSLSMTPFRMWIERGQRLMGSTTTCILVATIMFGIGCIWFYVRWMSTPADPTGIEVTTITEPLQPTNDVDVDGIFNPL